jgi:glucose-6-phosphate 1-dehydrogenase
MNRKTAAVCLLCAGASFAVCAADDPKQLQDLTAVIALQGKPCGQVVSYVAKADNDFVATCKDGNRYRVYVKDARVVVEKQ